MQPAVGRPSEYLPTVHQRRAGRLGNNRRLAPGRPKAFLPKACRTGRKRPSMQFSKRKKMDPVPAGISSVIFSPAGDQIGHPDNEFTQGGLAPAIILATMPPQQGKEKH